MIRFSVITVCLNAGEDLKRTAASVLRQTCGHFEFIIKDGLSQDGSIESLPEDSRIKLIRQRDRGIYDAMNQGIGAAAGDYLIFLNAGDCFSSDTVLHELDRAITDSGVSLYYGRCYHEALKVHSNSPRRLTPFFCYRSMICHQGMVFQRACLQARKYDCAYRVCADRELLMYAVVEKKWKTKRLPIVIARYKGCGFSEEATNKARIRAETLSLRKRYYTRSQRFCNELLLKMTFPALRRKIVKNPGLVRTYKRLVGMMYGSK